MDDGAGWVLEHGRHGEIEYCGWAGRYVTITPGGAPVGPLVGCTMVAVNSLPNRAAALRVDDKGD